MRRQAEAFGTVLERGFYARDAATVARALLGAHLVHCLDGIERAARIVETEAYVGIHDAASHASRGRTARTEVMFGRPGYVYVYLIYGMYAMFNIVTGAEGQAQAVLVRAAEPIGAVRGPLVGPGRLTRTLGITLADNRADLCGSKLFLRSGPAPLHVVAAPRVGVDYAGDWAAAPLRFYDAESPHVSRR